MYKILKSHNINSSYVGKTVLTTEGINVQLISNSIWMRSSRVVIRAYDLTVNAKVAIVLGSIPASSNTVKSNEAV